MAKYQVQYKNNSKTFNEIFEANSYIEIADLFQGLINCEITEVREIVYTNNHYPIDDGNYIKSVSCFIKGSNNSSYTFKIPKMKKTISETDLTSHIKSYIKIGHKTPQSLKITQKF